MMTKQDLNFEELSENLSLLDDWEERYSYILDIGRDLADYPTEFKNENFIVKGCVSQVWLYPEALNSDRLLFLGDSDSYLVRGLIAVILTIFNNQSAHSILEIDFDEKFKILGLSEHLTPQRSNGVFSMVNKIREYAENVSKK